MRKVNNDADSFRYFPITQTVRSLP